MEKYKFALAGNIIVDAVKYIDFLPEKLQLSAIERVENQLGGLVNNVGRTLAKLDPAAKTAVIGWIGEDAEGDFVLRELAKYPCLDTRFVKRQGKTSFTDVFTLIRTGERTFFTYKGADSLLAPEDIPYAEIQGAILHMGYALLLSGMDAPDAEYGTVLARTLAMARERGIITSVDVVSESGDRFERVVRPALKHADYLTVNDYEAGRITGIPLRDAQENLQMERLPQVCRALKDMGVKRWAVVHMPEIACGVDEEGRYWEAKSLNLPKGFIKSSVGAGDAFVAGLLYEAQRGSNMPAALRAANAVAASCLSQEGVQPMSEVMKLYDRFPVRV
ncbi:MAG: carbohydrate kinase family protein [Eubacteriales bacterium]|nr:carbohydrate kinase family protein [Eubacteriales bacterium]